MKNLIVYYDPELTTRLEDVPIPDMGPHEILIRVVAAGMNPKDWKHPMPQYFNSRINQGDDVAGIVEGFGHEVKGFKFGERVAGFHQMGTPRGTYAEYCVCPEQTVFHIPDSMSFEEAATIPLAAYTAAVGLYRNLRLPMPFERTDALAGIQPEPLVINGASGAVGSFALKFAKLTPATSPVIAIAGASADFVKENGADIVLNYRNPTVRRDLANALEGKRLRYALDAANNVESLNYILPNLDSRVGRYTCTTSVGEGISVKSSKKGEQQMILELWEGWWQQIWVGSIHEDNPAGGIMFAAVTSKILEMEMAAGRFSGHPYEIVEGGLNGVLGALKELRDGRHGNKKYVVRIADTEGLS
jgi:NADPH:quinone reductase-like Zn-dependent oxidoreductase